MTHRTSQKEGPLTHAQMQIWMGQRLAGDSPLYNMAFAWVFAAGLQRDVFRQAWQQVVEDSDALRTRVVEHNGLVRRESVAAEDCATQLLDRADSPDAFRQWCRERASRPLTLSERLVDSVLVDLADGKTGWYLSLHHLITDAASTVVLYRQVAARYSELIEGGVEPVSLAPYYATLEHLTSSAVAGLATQEHWTRRRERADRKMTFYGHDGEVAGTASSRLTLEIDADRARALERLSSEQGFASLSVEMSRFALFATLLASWLYRVGDRADLCFDAPVAGRPTAASKRALGLFVELFPFAVDVDSAETFRSLGTKCLAEAERLLLHALPGTSAPSTSTASQVVLNYFPQAFGSFAGVPAEVEWVHPGHGDGVHALRLQVHDFAGSGCYTLHFDFNDQLLPEHLQQRALEHFKALLTAMLQDPDAAIAAVDITSQEAQVAAHPAPLPEHSVLATIMAQANREAAALRQGHEEVTYGELQQRVDGLAATLVAHGVERGDRVAIEAHRSIDVVVAILATLRVRAAYVPLDPALPAERLATILADSSARLMLVSGSAHPTEEIRGVRSLTIAEGVRSGRGTSLSIPGPSLDDLAYVLYTSGSTGRPKGVLIGHDGLAAYLEWAARTYVRGERWSFPLFTSLAFDLTVTSLFLPLMTGGRLVIYQRSRGPVDTAMMDVASDDAVDFLKLTPSHLSLLNQISEVPTRLSCVVVGGEELATSMATEAQDRLGKGVEIYNEYGPTEAVVGCIAHRFDREQDTELRVPIGKPADGVRIEVLNAAGTPMPEGVAGELWISRYGLARGYLGAPALTAERFQSQASGERRYRTGDRVRRLAAGRLEFLGRLDRQLKISGHRVEPAEIESVLLEVPGVEQCAVIAQRRGGMASSNPESEEVRFCERCGLPSNHPRASLDRQGVCAVCRAYDAVKEHAQSYFRSLDDLQEIFARSIRPPGGEYDCMMLLSGGKDSTYALCQLVEMGLSVYAFSLDNGFISEGAKENIRKVAAQLEVPVELATTPAMNAIFRDSLERFSNVCQGCFKTIYTLSMQRARELGIPIIVTGLSRGQMFETRLSEEMFADGRHSAEEIDAAVLAARKVYHRADDEVARSLDVSIFQDDQVFEEVQFVDFYRFCDVGLGEIYAYLQRKVPWVRPEDTGRSTNCLINDLGIYIHKKERGYHNYALPYSWGVRLGHKTLAEARTELDDTIDEDYVRRTLAEIGCDAQAWLTEGAPRLVAYYVADSAASVTDADLRHRLEESLPPALVPTHLHRLQNLPLTTQGKLDTAALPRIEFAGHTEAPYRAPDGPVEEFLSDLWQQQLGVERAGADDSFFELGGTSLAAMEVMLQVCREFAIELPLETLFQHPRLSQLGQVVEERILADVSAMSEAEQLQLEAVSSGSEVEGDY